MRGPRPETLRIWTDRDTLTAWSRTNLNTYWRWWQQRSSAPMSRAGLACLTSWGPTWGVLGVSRLHYTVSTGLICSKTDGGRYARGLRPALAPSYRRVLTHPPQPPRPLRLPHSPDTPPRRPEFHRHGDQRRRLTVTRARLGDTNRRGPRSPRPKQHSACANRSYPTRSRPPTQAIFDVNDKPSHRLARRQRRAGPAGPGWVVVSPAPFEPRTPCTSLAPTVRSSVRISRHATDGRTRLAIEVAWRRSHPGSTEGAKTESLGHDADSSRRGRGRRRTVSSANPAHCGDLAPWHRGDLHHIAALWCVHVTPATDVHADVGDRRVQSDQVAGL